MDVGLSQLPVVYTKRWWRWEYEMQEMKGSERRKDEENRILRMRVRD
jgi:hypothetical protein